VIEKTVGWKDFVVADRHQFAKTNEPSGGERGMLLGHPIRNQVRETSRQHFFAACTDVKGSLFSAWAKTRNLDNG
jgi:hypothetical protein